MDTSAPIGSSAIRHRPSAIRLFRQTPDGGSLLLLLLIQANEIRAQRLNKTRNLPNIDRWRRSREEQGGGGERKCGQPSQWSTSSDTSDTSDIFRHRLRLGGIGINQSQSKPIRAALSLSLSMHRIRAESTRGDGGAICRH